MLRVSLLGSPFGEPFVSIIMKPPLKMKHTRPITTAFLKKNPDYFEEFEEDWQKINSYDSEQFLAWLDSADPTAIENYRVFSGYKNRKPTFLDKLGKFIHGLDDFFETPFGGFIAKIFGAALTSVNIGCFYLGGFSLILALIGVVCFIGGKLFAVNLILGVGYVAFMVIFIPTLLQCLFD
jgi:hypothetical protein